MMTITWHYWLALLITDALLISAWLWLNKRQRLLVADKVAVAALSLGVNTFFLIRAFIIDPSQCHDSPTLACLLNTNRGVWTFGALCVAAITLYVNARMKQRDERRTESIRRDNASRAIMAALDELIHNLQHFAAEIDDNYLFKSFPATAFDSTFALLHGEISTYCSPVVTSRIGTMQRIMAHNKAMLRSAAELDNSMNAVALMDDVGIVRFSRTALIKKVENESPQDAEASAVKSLLRTGISHALNRVSCDERIITHSIRCVMEITFYHPAASTEILSKPEFRWLTKFHKEAKTNGNYYFYPKSSDVDEREAAELRAGGNRVYCWIKDSDIENVEIISMRTTCRDLSHHH